jgi:hypothetical protein
MIRHLDDEYSPLYFLAALGAGGMAVSFFLYPMFMVKHPSTPLVTFNHLWPLLTGASLAIRGLVAFAMAAMAYFSVLHFRLLIWNIREYRRYRSTEAFTKLTQSNKEVGLMTIPLTLAMSINVCFVIGAVFVPNLWSVVEYLFPFAILGFLAVGAYALKIYTRFLTRVLVKGSFDFVENNSLEQMIAVFAFAMISVGLAAPGAMSHHPEVNAIGIFFSILFASMAVLLGFIKFVLGFKSMLRHGVAPAGGATLWILIPILTLLGIAMIRMHFGLHHGFKEPVSGPGLFVLTSIILSLQILFGMIGYLVMKSMGYFNDYLKGDEHHPGAFTLVCPGVAFFVFGMFFIVFGLERNGLVERFSLPYFIILAPFVYVQIKTILTITKLNRKLLHTAPG